MSDSLDDTVALAADALEIDAALTIAERAGREIDAARRERIEARLRAGTALARVRARIHGDLEFGRWCGPIGSARTGYRVTIGPR
jgi:hypothetical protein